MSVTLWIPPDLQFGGLAPGEARQGAMRQAVAQAIRSRLFGGTPSESGSHGSYDRALIAFAKVLSQELVAPDMLPDTQALWADLVPREELAAEVAVDSEQVPGSVEGAFCLSVQALASALAFNWVDTPGSAGDDEIEEENDEASDAEAVGEASPRSREDWRVDYQRVVWALAALLRQACWRWLRDRGADGAGSTEELRFIATLLLNTLLGVLGDWFAVEAGETEVSDGEVRTYKRIVLRQPELVHRLERLLAELPFRFTLHPLKEPVAYQPGDRGSADREDTDYFRIDLIGYRRSNAFLRRLHAGATDPHHCAPDFLRYVEAVNIQQAVPWRINRGVLHWARSLVAIGDGVASGSETERSLVGGIDRGASADLVEWVREHFYRPSKTGTRKAIERPGEFLDSPLARRVIEDLCRDGPDGRPVAFYLPWKADYRGRIYAETPWLTPQGGDLQRALFEFARGRPLDEEGVRALRRHGANLVRRSQLVADLAVEGRQVVTLEERERWVLEHEAEILASAASPLTEAFWRQVAGKPMQFLAFCLAYRQWKLDPSAPIHVPVQIDGTCNGLQHIAALTGDADLARAVNVLPREDGLPGDIYSELAAAAADNLGRLPFEGHEDMHHRGLELADTWLVGSPRRSAWLNRDTAKKVVMTIPYGASRGTQARHVLEAIAGAFEREWRAAAPPIPELDALVAWKDEHKRRQKFVARCTSGPFGRRPKAAVSGTDELSSLLATLEWERRRTLAAYAALALVRQLHGALGAAYPSVNAFSRWLRQTAEACEGLPLLWQSPLGFPVCQNKFKLRRTSRSGRLGTKQVRIEVQQLDERAVAARKQGDALLPNLIHSLDATHLAMALLEAKARGVTDIGSIHDCLLCHANDAAALALVARNTFARLYQARPDGMRKVLADWSDWMQELARLNALSDARPVLGALDHPDGMGERTLSAYAIGGGAQGAPARYALAVIEELRRLPPSRQFLARRLLEFTQTEQKERQEQERGQEQATETIVPAEVPALEFSADVALGDGSALSGYFFS